MSRSVRLAHCGEAQQVLRHHLATRGHIVWLAEGNSMWPWVISGTRVEIERCQTSDLAIGDVVLFCRHAGFGLHRVIDRTHDGPITRGDAHTDADGVVPFCDVLGKVKGLVMGSWVWAGAPLWLVRLSQRLALYAGYAVRALRSIWKVTRNTPMPRFAR